MYGNHTPFGAIQLGDTNMKKKKIECKISDNSKVVEKRYQQKLKANQCIVQMVFSSFSQCCWVPFEQIDLFVKQPEDNANRNCLKSKKIK